MYSMEPEELLSYGTFPCAHISTRNPANLDNISLCHARNVAFLQGRVQCNYQATFFRFLKYNAQSNIGMVYGPCMQLVLFTMPGYENGLELFLDYLQIIRNLTTSLF